MAIRKGLQRFKRIFPIISLMLLIVLCLPTQLSAAENLHFENITANDGLSQSHVLCMLQDSHGFMWMGTQDGLNKYDGYNFIVYKYNELDPYSLSDNFVVSIYEDKLETIWIGTYGSGINQFNRQTNQFTRYKHDPKNPHSLSNNKVWSIFEDQIGTLWIGTDEGGLNKYDRETRQFNHYKHNPDDPKSLANDTVLSIYEDKLGNFWIGTGGGGLDKFDRKTGEFTHYTHDPNNPHALSDNTVLSIYEDQSGRLWIGTNGGGLNQFDRETGQFIHYTHDPNNPKSLSNNSVSAIIEDRFGNLWLATSSWYSNPFGTALNKFEPETGQFTHYTHNPANPNSLEDNLVFSLLIDNSEILWIGTGFTGISKLDTKAKKFRNYKNEIVNPNSLSDNHVSSIYEDRNGILWIGTFDWGLNQFERETGKFTHYTHDSNKINSLSSDFVWSVYEDHNNTLWVGTFEGGLNKFDNETGQFTHYIHDPNNPKSLSNNNVISIYEDHNGTLWIGTFDGGLNKFERETGIFTHYINEPHNPYSLSDNNVLSIYEDQSDTLWIGTFSRGLNKFNRETGEFIRYTHDLNNPNSLSYDRVLSIYEYPAGTLWIGTYGGGLNKFDIATETFTHYTEKDGLPNNSVVGILGDDEGNLWLSTGKGLSKFNPETETFRNYDVGDGLQGNEFGGIKAYFKSKTGEMFFGGLNGFNAFYPEQVKDNPYIPPIVITDFRIFDKSVKLDTAISETKEIKLSYKDNFFGFEFAALDYTNPEKNQYAYKLEGFDKDWIYSGSRRYATYTNLDGGTYIFRVKGSNNDGVWNEEGTSLKVIITPPPWKTWWAYTLYVVAFVSAVYGYIQWRTRAQAKENALLRESERKLQQFLEAVPIGVGVVDTAGKPVYFNQSGLQLIGRETAPEAPPEQYSEAYQIYLSGTKQLYSSENLPLVRALKGEKTTVDDLEIHQPDKIVPLETWGTPIYDEQGAIIYAIAAFQDITERKLAEVALRTSLREKEVLLQEVHHRVKNNLQIICSLLDLQSQSIQEPQVLEIFHSSQNRIRCMALIHEELYQSQTLAHVNLAHYIRELTAHLLQSYALNPEDITLKLNLDEILSTLDTAIPCGLILNELISNALKDALNGGTGAIWVELKSKHNQITLVVGNNQPNCQKILDFNNKNSLGFQLVEVLVSQLEGEMEIEQNHDTVFKISFPCLL
ncbi:MAG: PAS domain-containing protein [Coleofasciculus sp. S288]|nr:PAS domain-containing protein [Coleofasciculus sp. S288]